jgi:dUTP pyrophosphatase
MIQFKKLTDNAITPRRTTEGAAGFDIYCNDFVTLRPSVHCLLPTGIAMAIPHGWVGLIWPRSGLAAKHGINVLAGVVDADYRGEVKVSLINHGHDVVEFKPGDRIAQILFQPVLLQSIEVDELSDTVRGDGGFGSTGMKDKV